MFSVRKESAFSAVLDHYIDSHVNFAFFARLLF